MHNNYTTIRVSEEEAGQIAGEHYRLKGEFAFLPGELDFNFKVQTSEATFLLKITRPDPDERYISFQNSLLEHLETFPDLITPKIFHNKENKDHTVFQDRAGKRRIARLLSWIPGRIWSEVNPVNPDLLFSLGQQAGKLTEALESFEHKMAHRSFDWELNGGAWVQDHLYLFDEHHEALLTFFLKRFIQEAPEREKLRKSVIHNDANDNNIIVTENVQNPEVVALIDFGDAIYSPAISDAAVTIAYAVMDRPDPLSAACQVIKGYHHRFPLQKEELKLLYTLIAMRLVISVTKAALNKKEEPENEYLLISERRAWKLLEKWKAINPEFAYYSFRHSCGYVAQPEYKAFLNWAAQNGLSIQQLFPGIGQKRCFRLDLGMESTFLGHPTEFNDLELFEYRLARIQRQYPDAIPAGGYLETRPIYTTDEYRKEGNSGPEYRSVHLGIDFWLPAGTAVHAPFDGEVITARNDKGYKEYGGMLILKHKEAGLTFYTLYGHQSPKSVKQWKKGDFVPKGSWLSELGTHEENGNWGTHLHFQVMLDVLGNASDFPGVCYPDQKEIWSSVCPDPNVLFREESLQPKEELVEKKLLGYRQEHLGKSLSLTYNKPLHIVRGDGAWLIDIHGRKYLDTVNNVAHTGHENPRVYHAIRNQAALLNTNTRYLNRKINEFTEALLDTLPEELSVVHMVNSGSEANELALRMAKTLTGQKDMIAVEVGYHGNTAACIDVSSYKFDGKGGTGAPEYTHIVPLPDTYRGIYRGHGQGEAYASHVAEKIGQVKEKGRNIAGFICESIISCGGQIELPEGYLHRAVASVRNAGGVYIADEVQVGCGRLGTHYWGFQQHDVIPDILTIGKPIGNGHPLGVVVCTREVADAFANGMEYFNTFGGNPVSCAAGLEVLKIIRDENLMQNAHRIGEYLKQELSSLQKEFKIMGDVRGKGLFLGIEMTGPGREPLPEQTAYLINRMKTFGILMGSDGRDVNVLKIKPPMVFSRDHANELINRLQQVLGEDPMRVAYH
jgi:4-aminobutyrate aminotransferase-like enzyme/Ser/Thr protein kinase RdoA (MazF antagonist)